MLNWIKHHLAEITAGMTILLVVAIAAAFVQLGAVSSRVAHQAEAGSRARQRQIQAAPIGCKQAVDAYVRGVITRRDLETYVAGALAPCRIP